MRKGIKKVAIVVMAIALMLGTLALVTGCDRTTDLTLQQRVTEAGQQVQQLQNGSDAPTLSQIDALLKQLDALRAEVKRLQGTEAELLAQIDKYEGQLNGLRVTSIQAQIDALVKQIAGLQTGNAELQQQLNKLRKELHTMQNAQEDFILTITAENIQRPRGESFVIKTELKNNSNEIQTIVHSGLFQAHVKGYEVPRISGTFFSITRVIEAGSVLRNLEATQLLGEEVEVFGFDPNLNITTTLEPGTYEFRLSAEFILNHGDQANEQSVEIWSNIITLIVQ